MEQVFADWLSGNNREYSSQYGIKMHQQGRCIDLVITINFLSQYVCKCYIDKVIDMTSNHRIIITILGICNKKTKENFSSQLKFQKMDDEAFSDALQIQQVALT